MLNSAAARLRGRCNQECADVANPTRAAPRLDPKKINDATHHHLFRQQINDSPLCPRGHDI
eukprot:6618664-Pyramimonas_sp.AAC.1